MLNLAAGTGAPGVTGRPGAGIGRLEDIPTDAFFGLAVQDAVKKYLAMMKKKQSAKAIATALEHGGLTTTAKNFYSLVYTGLLRLQEAGEVVKVGADWGLPNGTLGFGVESADEARRALGPARKRTQAEAGDAGFGWGSLPNRFLLWLR
jgi:hypothetical protein